MKQETKKKSILIVQLLSLLVAFLICIVATVGITLAFFGNRAGGVATISLRGGVYVDGSFSAGATAQYVVPSQIVDVTGIANVSSRGKAGSATDKPTNAFLRAQVVDSSHSSGDNVNVTVDSKLTVQNTSCHWEYYDGWYYLCKGDSGTTLFEIDTTEHNSQAKGLEIPFVTKFQVNPSYANEHSGSQYTISVSFTAVQSVIGELTADELVCTNDTVIEAFDSIQ